MQNVVVLGAGHWHLPLYRDALRSRHRVVGVWDTDPNAAAKAGADLSAPAFVPDVDAVVAGVDRGAASSRRRPLRPRDIVHGRVCGGRSGLAVEPLLQGLVEALH